MGYIENLIDVIDADKFIYLGRQFSLYDLRRRVDMSGNGRTIHKLKNYLGVLIGSIEAAHEGRKCIPEEKLIGCLEFILKNT